MIILKEVLMHRSLIMVGTAHLQLHRALLICIISALILVSDFYLGYLMLMFIVTVSALLKQILKEVQLSNKKVDELEQEIKEMKDGACSSRLKKVKVNPSSEVRVSDS